MLLLQLQECCSSNNFIMIILLQEFLLCLGMQSLKQLPAKVLISSYHIKPMGKCLPNYVNE